MKHKREENPLLVSIIMTVYNVAPYLSEAIESVVKQTYKNLEIIIIDDGSTDESGIICDQYVKTDKRIKVIHQNNQGLSMARNLGLDMITGEVIAFIDPDDLYRTDYVMTMIDIMTSEIVDLVVCKYASFKSTDKVNCNCFDNNMNSYSRIIYNRPKALQALVESKITSHVWNKLYSAKLWKNIRFPKGHVYEDIDTTYQILNLCEMVCVLDCQLYFHRIREGSIVNNVSQKLIEDYLLASSHFDSFIKQNIPELFTVNHLHKRRQRMLHQMVFFLYYSS